jgi:hypothetical protein
MFFLDALCADKTYHILYAGSACGTHLLLLIKMFPHFKYTLIDPAEFDTRLFKYHQVTIINAYFTSAMAKTFKQKHAGNNLIFISDIRTEPSEEAIMRNMSDQEGWVRILRPQHSLLKFRLPWLTKKTKNTLQSYLDGKVYKQIWQPKGSTETRLWVKHPRKKKAQFPSKQYSCFEYEDKLFFHNMITRSQYFKYNDKYPWYKLHMDHCFDCTVEKNIHKRYIKSKFNVLKLTNAYQLSKLLTKTLTSSNDDASCLKKKWNKNLQHLK